MIFSGRRFVDSTVWHTTKFLRDPTILFQSFATPNLYTFMRLNTILRIATLLLKLDYQLWYSTPKTKVLWDGLLAANAGQDFKILQPTAWAELWTSFRLRPSASCSPPGSGARTCWTPNRPWQSDWGKNPSCSTETAKVTDRIWLWEWQNVLWPNNPS